MQKMASTLGAIFIFKKYTNGVFKMSYKTKYLSDFKALVINQDDCINYIVPTYNNENNYPYVNSYDLPQNIQNRAKFYHAWQSESPIIAVHRLVYVLYYNEDLKCDRLTHTGYIVHHLDKNPQNADISNLERLEYSKHKQLHKRGA